jgi:hypothetical protein
MNKPQGSDDLDIDKLTNTSQSFHIDSYPLTIILTINTDHDTDDLHVTTEQSDLAIKDDILYKIKSQLCSCDQADHILDYNFRVVINDKIHNRELTSICCKIASNIGFNEKNDQDLLRVKRIMIHFITLSKLQSCVNRKFNNYQIENISGGQARISFDVSATNGYGEILC